MFLLWAIVSPIIENSPIKAFDNVIAKAKELSDEETTLVFTHIYYKQRKMSLYVYGRQKFEKTTYLGAIEDAPDFYKQEGKKIFLLDQDKLERYRKQFKKAGIPFDPVPCHSLVRQTISCANTVFTYYEIGKLWNQLSTYQRTWPKNQLTYSSSIIEIYKI